jgi:hypothetical protein
LLLYLWCIYTVPFHVNSDESVILAWEQEFVGKGIVDFFGLSNYYAFPYMPFLAQGWLAKFLGGIDLYHVRFVHAFTGTIIVACSYAFFRVLNLRWPLAVAATVFVAFNHSLIGINRVVSQTNTGLLMELIALTAVYGGIKRRCPFATYLGGVLTGLCFYVYYSARLTLPICLLFFVLLFCFKQKLYPPKQLAHLSLIFVFGVMLGIAPLAAAMTRQSDLARESRRYVQRVSLLFPLGQQLAKDRWGKDGVTHCIVNGLTVFNNDEIDQIFIYPNRHHGFIDPISGVLLWLGIIRALLFLRRRLSVLFALTGFFFEYLLYSLITFPSPDYTRLLVLLPFAGYFVAYGIDLVSSFAGLLSRKCKIHHILTAKYIAFCCISLAVAIINLVIFGEYAAECATHGDDIGGVARYVEARKSDANHLYIVVSSLKYPFFTWPDVDWCYRNIQPYISPKQDNEVLAPDDLTAITIVPPFSLFMNGKVWTIKQDQLKKKYPDLNVHRIADDENLVAVENPVNQPNSRLVHELYKKWKDYPSKIDDAFSKSNNADAERLSLEYLSAPTSMIGGSYVKSTILMRLGAACIGLQKLEKAESALLEAMKIRQTIEGDRALGTADAADALGELYACKNDWQRSEQYYKRAIAMREAYEQDEGIDWVWGLANEYRFVARARRQQGKFEEAENTYKHAAYLCKTDRDETHDKEEILKELSGCQKEHLESVGALSRSGN